MSARLPVLNGLMIFAVTVFLSGCNNHNSGDGSVPKTDLRIISHSLSEIKAGFASVPITPEVPDRWIDKNNDSKYKPVSGDTYTDGNGNGKFDPVWMAGFSNKRAANGIHDDLWARTIIIDDSKTRVAIVSLDLIGFMNNYVDQVRRLLSPGAGITYLIVTSTHTHEGPDMLGLWGRSILKSGVNNNYAEFVVRQVVKSVETAAENLRPAYLSVSEDLMGPIPLVTDTRKPFILDPGLRIVRAVDKQNGMTLGSLISWADHPETLWGKNLLITSDFPHYLREGVEKGIFKGDSLFEKGTGGTTVYVSGAIGGLMSTTPLISIKDIVTGTEYKDPSFEKAKALGEQLAVMALHSMAHPSERIDSGGITLITRNIFIPLDNKLLKLGKLLGIFKRGTRGLKNVQTEVALLEIGNLSFVTFPGEVYPEIVNGGIEAPEGNDYSVQPQELPPVRDIMPGKYKLILGLANDELGYIIPKSEWDSGRPYMYGRTKAPYGEDISPGPETAPILHMTIKEMIGELK